MKERRKLKKFEQRERVCKWRQKWKAKEGAVAIFNFGGRFYIDFFPPSMVGERGK